MPSGTAAGIEERLAARVRVSKYIGGNTYFDEAAVRKSGLAKFSRGRPLSETIKSKQRQTEAIFAAPSREAQLRRLDLPVLVVHGCEDVFVRHENAPLLHEYIPGSRLLMVEGMGHGLCTS